MKRFFLSLIILTTCGGTEVAEEPSTTTTQQDTTTTTQQDTTTTTQQDTTTTTILVKINVDPAEFCKENPDNEQCKVSGSENTQGNQGMAASDDPPLLENLLILNWGPYDPPTGISGDFEFREDMPLTYFDEFGRVHSPGTSYAYDNPTFEYKVPRDTKVYIPITGIVDFFSWQPTGSYKQDDWEVMIKPSRASNWSVVIDHVVALSCNRSVNYVCDDPLTINGAPLTNGMQVKAGDLLGYVGNYEDGEGGTFGRTEIAIGEYVMKGNQRDFNNYCPTNYLKENVKSSIQASVNQIMASYESWLGDSTFYNEANMVAPGCWYSEIYESQGKTTPTK